MDGRIIFLLVAVAVCVVYIIVKTANMKQRKIYIYKEHVIEVHTGYRFAKLIVDGEVVDEISASNITVVKLSAAVKDLNIRSNIRSYFLTLNIKTFANNEELHETKLDKSDLENKSMFDEK